MLSDGLIVVAKHGHMLDLSPKEVAFQFEEALPRGEGDMDDGIWFFTDACPAGIGWCTADGGVDWV